MFVWLMIDELPRQIIGEFQINDRKGWSGGAEGAATGIKFEWISNVK